VRCLTDGRQKLMARLGIPAGPTCSSSTWDCCPVIDGLPPCLPRGYADGPWDESCVVGCSPRGLRPSIRIIRGLETGRAGTGLPGQKPFLARDTHAAGSKAGAASPAGAPHAGRGHPHPLADGPRGLDQRLSPTKKKKKP